MLVPLFDLTVCVFTRRKNSTGDGLDCECGLVVCPLRVGSDIFDGRWNSLRFSSHVWLAVGRPIVVFFGDRKHYRYVSHCSRLRIIFLWVGYFTLWKVLLRVHLCPQEWCTGIFTMKATVYVTVLLFVHALCPYTRTHVPCSNKRTLTKSSRKMLLSTKRYRRTNSNFRLGRDISGRD